MTSQTAAPVLVAGATGRIGGQVVQQLLTQGHAVRALTRSPDTARLPAGVEIVQGDLGRPETLTASLAGVRAVHLINYDAASGTVLGRPADLVSALTAAGVRRVTSFRGEPKGALEAALAEGPFSWTDVHVPVEFMANMKGWAEAVRTDGTVSTFGPSHSAAIDEADVAAVLVAALTEEGHGGRTYVLTGPEVLTPEDKVRILSDETGLSLTHQPMTVEQAEEKWRGLGYPEDIVRFLSDWHQDPPEDARTVSPSVEAILGRPPRTFRDWVRGHRDLFLYEAPVPGVFRFTIADAGDWMVYSGTELADVVNEDEHSWAKLGAVGFTRAKAGAQVPFEFAYDEVLVVTRGRCAVSHGSQRFSAGPGEVLYLRAGEPAVFHAEEDVEIVYVASSPYGAVNRQAKADLLNLNQPGGI